MSADQFEGFEEAGDGESPVIVALRVITQSEVPQNLSAVDDDGRLYEVSAAQLMDALTTTKQSAQQLVEVIEWALGERDDFPDRPERVEGKPYPWYWWRTEMRARLVAALASSSSSDKDRLDWLEGMANEPGGLLLHDGLESGRRGIGLRSGRQVRSLRQAVDMARRLDA